MVKTAVDEGFLLTAVDEGFSFIALSRPGMEFGANSAKSLQD
ncbi:hypothetical protein ACQ4M3_20260 [Leptolyngbya sp. AN03gr2]